MFYSPVPLQQNVFWKIIQVQKHLKDLNFCRMFSEQSICIIIHSLLYLGKTFTIVGTVSEPGIIPRTLEYLFRTVPNLSEMPLVKPTQCGKVAILDKLSSQREINIRNELLSIARTTIDERHTDTYR